MNADDIYIYVYISVYPHKMTWIQISVPLHLAPGMLLLGGVLHIQWWLKQHINWVWVNKKLATHEGMEVSNGGTS